MTKILEEIEAECRDGEITLGDLTNILVVRGHLLVTLILGLPFLLPIPLPGLSILLGVVIALAGGAFALQRPIWIPAKWRKKRLPPGIVAKVLQKARKLFGFIERYVQNRGEAYLRGKFLRMLSGSLIVVCGLLLALPLPPGTNFPPALGIILLSLGTLEDDLVVVSLGYLAVLINGALFYGLIFQGASFLKSLV